MQLKQATKLALGRVRQAFGPKTKKVKISDYNDYILTQKQGFEAKRNTVFARPENIAAIVAYAQRRGPVNSVLCHGTRNGAEQRFFIDALPRARVLGTEIGDGASEYPNTVEWDFHETKPEWLGAWDLIYSNSWDHAADPERAFKAWCSCLSSNGLLVLEHSEHHTVAHVRDLDPFGASFKGLIKFCNLAAAPRSVIDTLSLPYRLNDQRAVVIG